MADPLSGSGEDDHPQWPGKLGGGGALHDIMAHYLFPPFLPPSLQELFDTIPTDLTADLTEEQQHGLDQCLRRFDLDSLLVTLYEFIETHVRHIDMNSNEKDWT